MYRWCIAAFNSGLWNIATPIEQVLDGRVVQTHVKINALCKQRWPSQQHPRKNSGHVLHLLCHQGPLGPVACSRTQNTSASGQDTTLYHETAKHGYSGVVKESTGCDENMLCLYACMRVLDIHVHGVDLVSVIFRSAFAHDTQAPPQASWCVGAIVITRGRIWCFCREN